MKFDEVIKDFKELYRERVDQYMERYIQQRYTELGRGKIKLKRMSDLDFFEIDLNDFEQWLQAEISSIDGKIGKNTAEDISSIYYTPTMIGTSDKSYSEQEQEITVAIPTSVHSTQRIYLSLGKIHEYSLERVKMLARALMNGQPIPLIDGDNTIFIGDGEVFYVNPGSLEEPLVGMKTFGPDPHGVLPITYGKEKESGSHRSDIYRISKDGVTLFLTKTRDGFKKREDITLPLKTDSQGNLQTDLDIFTSAISYQYSRRIAFELNAEDVQKMVSTLRGVLQKTSRSFSQLETETELRKKIEELQASLDGKETSIAQLMATYTDRGERDEASITALGEELRDGKSRIETLTVENGRLTEENETLKKKQGEQTAQIQTLEQNNTQLETRAKAAEDNSDTLRKRIEQLKERVMQVVGKVPFVGKRVKLIFDEDVLMLPSQTQKEDDFRARLQVAELTDIEIMDGIGKMERRVSEEKRPPMRKRTSERDDDKLEL